ncbi:MAG: amidohydrolase family protein, partial [Balneolaceae bacterium]|nr:amidohydrolase family protein [Balneolaceae bacterium]
SVSIRYNKITRINRSTYDTPSAGTELVDGCDKYLIPGLWDMHSHRSWNYFGTYIANGVIGVRDMGNPVLSLVEIEELRQKIHNGHIIGPRIVTAGHQIINKSTNDRRVEATTPKRGRQVVDSLKAAGADFIKVYNLSRQTFFAIADQAEKRGIPIAGHLSPEVTLTEASKAGQKNIEHYTVFKPFGLIPLCSSRPEQHRHLLEKLKGIGVPPTDSVHIAQRHKIAKLTVESYDEDRCRRETKRLAEYDTWHTPTLIADMMHPRIHNDRIFQNPIFKYGSPTSQKRYEWIRSLMVANFSESLLLDYQSTIGRIITNLQRGGVGILAGTDNGGFYGFGLHQELGLLVEAGLSPLESLQAATLNAAKYLGRSDDLGAVEVGKLADLVLLDANPLEDISNTQKIRAVVANGRYLNRSELDRILKEVEVLTRGKSEE